MAVENNPPIRKPIPRSELLSPEELEALREDTKRASEKIKAILRAREKDRLAPTEFATMMEDAKSDSLRMKQILASRENKPE